MRDGLTVYTVHGQLGYGVSRKSMARAKEDFDIDVLAADAGSIDSGPHYLGTDRANPAEKMIERDLRIALKARDELDVPLLISSVGTSGSDAQVDKTVDLMERIAAEEELQFKYSYIYTEVDGSVLKDAVRRDAIRELDFEKELSTDDIDESDKIVAMVDEEPYVESLENDVDVVIGGRSIDVAPFAALPIKQGYNRGLSYHMAKIIECGPIGADRKSGAKSMVGEVADDFFEVVPPEGRATTESVSAHSLYEKTEPDTIYLPTGEVKLTNSKYEQVSDRRVRVEGSEFRESEVTTYLLEGVRLVGYRTISIGGVSGPEMAAKIDEIADAVEEQVDHLMKEDEDYHINIRKYGHDAVGLFDTGTGPLTCEELGIVIDSVGETQKIADKACKIAKVAFLHHEFDERYNTSGNMAFPFSPTEFSVGEVYEFSVHHLLEATSSEAVYELRYGEIDRWGVEAG